MSNEMFDRLRRFGDTVDQAAVAAGAPAGPLRDVSDPLARVDGAPGAGDGDDLEPVAPITGRRDRRYRAIMAAAAALIIVVAGAIVTSRITGSPDSGASASTEEIGSSTTTTTEPKETTSTTAAVVVPISSADATTTSTSSSTSSSTTTTTDRPHDPVCPDYHYNVSYPIRLCDKGPAVVVIQERLGVVDADGFFGPGTQQAVRQFQLEHALEVDGLVGPDTWSALVPGVTIGDVSGTGTVEPNVTG